MTSIKKRRSRAPGIVVLLALPLLLPACGDGQEEPTEPVKPSAGLAFAYVDVAAEWGYVLRNRTGSEGSKNFILEAMPPGVAVGDFNGDGWMDLYCPNGNNILRYDPKLKKVTLIADAEAPRNALYWNREGKRLEEGAKAAGTDDTLWSFGAVAGDIDNDGDTDIYLCNWGTNRLYLNRGDGTFEDVAGPSGAAGDPRAWSAGACFLDYDRDGDLDVYVAQYADVYDLLDRPAVTTIGPDGRVNGRHCDWRKLKVYCGPIGLKPLNDVLFKNLLMESGELKFSNVTRSAGLWMKVVPESATEFSPGPYYGFQPVAWDIDGDGWSDIFVANDSVPNTCWINGGDGTFEDRADLMSLDISMSDNTPQASMGVAVGDINADGHQDIVITEFSHDQFNLLLGEKLESGMMVFNEKAAKVGLRQMTFVSLGWGAILLDPDLDGDLDIFFACGHVYPEVDGFPQLQTPYKQFNLLILNQDPRRPVLESLGGRAGPGLEIQKCTRAAAVVDIDNDGDPDIATSELNDIPCLLRCDVRGDRHWLAVRLRGDPARKVPTDPAGAVVRVRAGGLQLGRVLMLGSSFQCSEDPRLLFGLGSHSSVDVEVSWPNGDKTSLEGVSVDRLLQITLD